MNGSWNIKKQFLVRAVLPVIGLGLILAVCGYYSFRFAMLGEARKELENVGNAVLLYYDYTYPGDFVLTSDVSSGKTKYELEKGDTVITRDYSFIDDLKAKTDIEITIYYADTIILTTIGSDTGNRPVGFGCPNKILEEVLNQGKTNFYDDTAIGETNYYAYYAPIKNSENQIIGMIFAGKPSEEIQKSLIKALIPLILIGIVLVIGIGAASAASGQRFVSAIEKVDKYFKAVSEGNLNALLHQEVAGRKDELGDMARNAQTMQKSLKKLIECDGLTELFNRRYAEKRLNQVYAKNTENETPFCVSIVDIDFFKKVNDTYGHEAGDIVLKGVSRILEKNIQGHGYVARWGGEEFLLVFEQS
ncbi:MAG: diguanylate cyclase, partial [Lachnospiraceae bacterium]|nr:diguanylate cyclase [Lachnospiraceae bacterium]